VRILSGMGSNDGKGGLLCEVFLICCPFFEHFRDAPSIFRFAILLRDEPPYVAILAVSMVIFCFLLYGKYLFFAGLRVDASVFQIPNSSR